MNKRTKEDIGLLILIIIVLLGFAVAIVEYSYKSNRHIVFCKTHECEDYPTTQSADE